MHTNFAVSSVASHGVAYVIVRLVIGGDVTRRSYGEDAGGGGGSEKRQQCSPATENSDASEIEESSHS